jgi:DNA-binding transcriptional regulator YhcF (GntR family)
MAELTPSTREAARRLGVSDTTMHNAYWNKLQRRCVLRPNNLMFTDNIAHTLLKSTNSLVNHCKLSIVGDTIFSL